MVLSSTIVYFFLSSTDSFCSSGKYFSGTMMILPSSNLMEIFPGASKEYFLDTHCFIFQKAVHNYFNFKVFIFFLSFSLSKASIKNCRLSFMIFNALFKSVSVRLPFSAISKVFSQILADRWCFFFLSQCACAEARSMHHIQR